MRREEVYMAFVTWLLLLAGQIETKESPDFSKALQTRAVTATVRVSNPGSDMEGSGVLVGRNGSAVYVLTAYHVVKDAATVDITVFSEKSYPVADKVYRANRVVAKMAGIKDLALVLLLTDDKTLSMVPVCPLAQVPLGTGQPILTSGCTFGLPPTCTVERIGGTKKGVRNGESALVWEIDGTVPRGRSGGPLIDKRGYVVGICSGTNNGKGYYCHLEEIQRFLKQNGYEWLAEKDAPSK